MDVAVMRQEEHCFKGVPKWVYLVEMKSAKAGESPASKLCFRVWLTLIWLRIRGSRTDMQLRMCNNNNKNTLSSKQTTTKGKDTINSDSRLVIAKGVGGRSVAK